MGKQVFCFVVTRRPQYSNLLFCVLPAFRAAKMLCSLKTCSSASSASSPPPAFSDSRLEFFRCRIIVMDIKFVTLISKKCNGMALDKNEVDINL